MKDLITSDFVFKMHAILSGLSLRAFKFNINSFEKEDI